MVTCYLEKKWLTVKNENSIEELTSVDRHFDFSFPVTDLRHFPLSPFLSLERKNDGIEVKRFENVILPIKMTSIAQSYTPEVKGK